MALSTYKLVNDLADVKIEATRIFEMQEFVERDNMTEKSTLDEVRLELDKRRKLLIEKIAKIDWLVGQ